MKAVRLYVLYGTACLVAVVAGCLQNRSNQIVAQCDQLVDNTEELLALLRSVKDPASANAATPKLPEAYEKVYPLLKDVGASARAADRRGGVTQEALQTVQRQVAEFQSICQQIEVEINRLRQLRGLPAEFWDVLRVEALTNLLLVVDDLPTGLSPEDLTYLKFVDQLISDYGPQRVVLVELQGSSQVPTDVLCSRLASIGGPNSRNVKQSSPAQVDVTIGPIDDFDAFAAAIDFGKVVDKDPAQRRIWVELAGSTPSPDTEEEVPQTQVEVSSPEQVRPREPVLPRAERSERIVRGDSNEPMSPAEVRATIESFVGGQQSLPNRSDPDYHQKLCDLLVDERSWHLRDEAIDALLRINPHDIENKEVSKQIARNFRELALDDTNPHDAGKAIRGLVLYGGRYSVPILIDRLRQERLQAPRELFDGLVAFPDEEGAEALAERLGDIFNHEAAYAALRRMGPVAEDALITAAPSDNPDVSLAAVKLLGDVGTLKCLPLLGKATRSSNPEVVQAARSSIKEIRERSKKTAE